MQIMLGVMQLIIVPVDIVSLAVSINSFQHSLFNDAYISFIYLNIFSFF